MMPSRQYKNAPIEEALCEITFSPSVEWNLTIPGKLHLELQDKYSGAPRQVNVQTVVTSAPNNIGLQNDLRVQFPTTDNTRVVSMGRNSVSVSVLKPYEGWEKFKPRIEFVLQAYEKVARPKSVIKIGVRYINRIVVPESSAGPAKYFSFGSEEERAVNARMLSFMRRSEYVCPDRTKILITHASIVPSTPERTEFLLDIDTVWDYENLEGFDQIMNAVEILHNNEARTFETLISDEARNLFDA